MLLRLPIISSTEWYLKYYEKTPDHLQSVSPEALIIADIASSVICVPDVPKTTHANAAASPDKSGAKNYERES